MCWSSAKDGVLSIMLARPERRNAITVAMYAALADAIESAADNRAIRLITIEGQGEDFTAGNDLGDFLQAMPSPDSGEDIPVWRLLRALARNQVPIVAAVHGNAVGIGTTMLFHCDFVLAEEGCRFVMPFVDLGLVPEAASSLLFPRLAGRRRAARHLLLGEPFGAAEALDMGLASHVVPQGQLKAALAGLVAALLAKPPGSAAPDPGPAAPRGYRGNPRSDGAGERPFRRAASIRRGQAGHHRLFRGRAAR